LSEWGAPVVEDSDIANACPATLASEAGGALDDATVRLNTVGGVSGISFDVRDILGVLVWIGFVWALLRQSVALVRK